MNYKYSINEHFDWYKGKNLSETCHMFEPLAHGKYRNILQDIAKRIKEKNNFDKNNIDLFNTNNPDWYLYTLHCPFINVKRLNIIDNLKVYVTYNEQPPEAAQSINDESLYNEDWYNESELPLFQSYGHHINVLSILLYLNNESDTDKITSLLAHELQHALDLIGNNKIVHDTNVGNAIYDDLYALSELTKDIPIYINHYSIAQYIKLLGDSAYYTQDTEINAHIESCIAEFKHQKLPKSIALNICKHINNSSNMYEQLPTLDAYTKIHHQLTELKNFIIAYPKFNSNNVLYDVVEISRQYKVLKDTEGVFELIDFYIRKIEKFFKRLGHVVYVNY